MIELPTFVQVVDFLGTFAFAISGIRLASAKRFDFFGAYVVGLTTAVGGGTMRDLILGISPFWTTTPFYLVSTALALLWVVLFGKKIIRQNNTWFIFDTLGLALFTVSGLEKTLSYGFPWWVAIVMGAVTGAAGGVFRDVFINEVPLIFRKEIYALACLIGGAVYILIYTLFTQNTALCGIIAGLTVMLVRVLAVRFKLHLPILKGED